MSEDIGKIFKKVETELDSFTKNENNVYKYNGHDIDTERDVVLKCSETKDIQAYPGTGKTTILTDKIKLLQKHWDLKDSGILVLSHTNVAKNQIGKLSYPHYIDTIHGFANRFFGLPYIRSQGWKVKVIDDGLTDGKGKNIIGYNNFLQKKPGVYNKEKRFCFADIDLNKTFLYVDLGIKDTTDTAKKISECRTKLIQQGYFYHDDLLCFSLKLIKENQFLIPAIRKRFPFVFIDEAQDNSKLQSELLHELFVKGEDPSIIQRFGDINQKIYTGDEFNSWKFPNDDNKLEIKLSYRCKSKIANFASKFTKNTEDGDSFEGIKEGGSLCYIFFDEDNRSQVLEKFAKKIKELKLNTVDSFSSVAIGANNVNEKLCISSYYKNYSKDIKNAYPKTEDEAIEFAKNEIIQAGSYNKAYKILYKWYSSNEEINEQKKEDLNGEINKKEKDKLKEILNSKLQRHSSNEQNQIDSDIKSNIYKNTNSTEIRIDTIHGVKGETHNAVLVLDTKHGNGKTQLAKLLCKNKDNEKVTKKDDCNKELFFVAFSRATDLLCLAINDSNAKSSLQNAEFEELNF